MGKERGRQAGREEGKRVLELEVAFLKVITENGSDGYGRMREKGGNGSLGIEEMGWVK